MLSVLWFVFQGWWLGLCLWLAIRLVERGDGRRAGNPPLLALAVGFGFTGAAVLLGPLGWLSWVALFAILFGVYRLSVPAVLLTGVVMVAIQLGFVLALVKVLDTAGEEAAIGLFVAVIALSAYWWRHDLRMLGTWIRQRGEPRQPRVPRAKAKVKPARKPAATKETESPAPAVASPQRAPSPAATPARVTSILDPPPPPSED